MTLSSRFLLLRMDQENTTQNAPTSGAKKFYPLSSSPIMLYQINSLILALMIIIQRITRAMIQIKPEKPEDEESFYSIDNSKSEFTFVEEERPETEDLAQKLMEKFDIRQSSAVEIESEELLNRSFHSIVQNSSKAIELHDISAIDEKERNELECSVCLQNEIDCLSLAPEASPEELKALQEKITQLKNEQSLLQRQLQAFQQLMLETQANNRNLTSELMQASKFIKKRCEHDAEDAQPFNLPRPQGKQVTVGLIQQDSPRKEERQERKKFDIKPSKSQSASEKQANAKYKECSFNRKVTLLQDLGNQYRVEVSYQAESLYICLSNFQKGETNFLHAVRVNESEYLDKISEKIVYPLKQHISKRFTLSLSIMLLIFEQNREKEQGSLIKIEEIRSVSIPLPINYFIEPRFNHLPQPEQWLEKVKRRLYVYEIDINYSADYAAYTRLAEEHWIRSKWISLKGKNKLLWVQVGEIKEKEKENTFGVIFRIGCKEKDCQEAIDLIEYLCFMLAL